MAIEAGLVRAAANTTTGNQTFTDANMSETPNAALFFITEATTDGVAAVNATMGIGACDGTSEWAIAVQDEDGQVTTDSGRRGITDGCILIVDQAVDEEGVASFVSFPSAGAVTVNWDIAPSSAFLVAVHLFAVDNAEAGTFLTNGTVGGTTTITPGFQSTIIFAGTVNLSSFVSTSNSAHPGFGVCDADLNQYFVTAHYRHNQATTANDGRIRNDSFTGNIQQNAANRWYADVTSITATQFVVTQRENNLVRAVGYLALDTGAISTFVGGVDGPNSTGNQSITDPGWTPQMVGYGLINSEAYNTVYTDNRAGDFGLSAFTTNDEYSNVISSEDDVGTSNTQSLSDDTAINMPDDDGSAQNVAAFVSFDATGWTLNHTSVAANVKKWFAWAIEAEAVVTTTTTTTLPVVSVTIPSHLQSKELTVLFSDPLWFTDRRSLSTIEISNYSHELRAIGGYYSAKISIDDDQLDIGDWIESGIGRHIVSYNPELEVIGEYFVNKITANIGALQYSIGPLIALGNRLKARYSVVDTTVDPPIRGEQTETAVANNTDSQALFGIIDKVININSATATEATQIRDSILNDVSRAFPPTSRKSTLSGNEPRLTLDCLGYWHWLSTYLYNNSATGQINLSDKIIAVLADEPNSIFSTDTNDIESNTTQVSGAEDKDKKAITVLKYLNSLGDAANNRYNMGFYQDRKFRYGVAPSEVAYHQRITGNQGITTPIGGKVDAWNVLPARWLFYPDFLVGRHPPITSGTLSSDPRTGFIEVVKFSLPDALSVNGSKLDESDVLLERLGLKGTG
jgi:hypothetical protein